MPNKKSERKKFARLNDFRDERNNAVTAANNKAPKLKMNDEERS